MRYAPDGDDLMIIHERRRNGRSSRGDTQAHRGRLRRPHPTVPGRVRNKMQLKKYGGTSYSFILEKFLPELRSRGLSEEHIHTMTVETPSASSPS